MMLILNVVYVLIAIAIIVLVLMQRGSGAQAGSGFGAGASGTVFGARGASNFLSKSTKWLAIAFFSITIFMAWYASHNAQTTSAQSAGLMGNAEISTPATPASGELPAAPQPSTVPSAPVQPAPTGTAPQQPEQAAPQATEKPQNPSQGQ